MDFDDFGFAAQPTPPPPAQAAEEHPVVQEHPPIILNQPVLSRPAVGSHVARAKAGLGIVLAGAGAGVGALLGGPLGCTMGLVGVGAVRNLYRSQGIASSDPSERNEAARGLALGLVGVAIVGYLGYRLYRKED